MVLILRDGHVPTTSRWSSKNGWLQPLNAASSWCRMDQRRLRRAAGSRRGQLCEGRLGTGCFGNGLEVHLPVGVHGHNISKSYYGWSGLFGVGVAGVAASSVEGDEHLDNPSCTGGKVSQPSDEEQDSVAKTLVRWFGWPGLSHGRVLQDWMGLLTSRRWSSTPSLGAQRHCRLGYDRARLKGGKPNTKRKVAVLPGGLRYEGGAGR